MPGLCTASAASSDSWCISSTMRQAKRRLQQLRQDIQALEDHHLDKIPQFFDEHWDQALRYLRKKGMGKHRRGSNSDSGMRLLRRLEKNHDGIRSAVCSNSAAFHSALSGNAVPLPRCCGFYRERPSTGQATGCVRGGTHLILIRLNHFYGAFKTMYLVTGAPGWLGTRLLMALSGALSELKFLVPENGVEEIRCLVQPGINPQLVEKIHPRIHAYPGDVTEPSSLGAFFRDSEGAVLFHLVGIIHPSRRTREWFNINVRGTQHVLQAAIRHKVKRIVAISSNSPAGTNPYKDHVFTEDTPYNPYLLYGHSKMEMELMLNDAFRRGHIETVILRPCWFYGPGQPARQTLF